VADFMAHRCGMANESETPACAVCGKPAVVIINGVAWCDGCFHEMGSCCGEWHAEETEEKP
jgi:predicted amidophosphoribosyltransferase